MDGLDLAKLVKLTNIPTKASPGTEKAYFDVLPNSGVYSFFESNLCYIIVPFTTKYNWVLCIENQNYFFKRKHLLVTQFLRMCTFLRP